MDFISLNTFLCHVILFRPIFFRVVAKNAYLSHNIQFFSLLLIPLLHNIAELAELANGRTLPYLHGVFQAVSFGFIEGKLVAPVFYH